jgi:3-phenylpropionate/trans-cinnamate dioxygenase ferredoxin reductase component
VTDAGVVIVGTGQGGFQVAASLRKEGYEGPVTLVGEEPGLPYQRPPLSKEYMIGDAGPEKVHLRPEAFYAKQGIELNRGERLERIDRDGRRVELASGMRLPYEHLVLALGARPRPLPVPGGDLDGVHVLRTLADAEVLRTRLAEAQHVVVIGGGFIGMEFAAAARTRGVGVTVVEALDRPMARVVSPEISRYYTGRHEEAGAQVLLDTGVDELEGQGGKVTAVRTADGRCLPADLVVVGVGVVPNTEPAEAAGLVVDNGIVVDEHLTTSDPLISAIGDCAAYPSCHAGHRVRLESVQNAVDHGRCVAARIAGRPAPYTSVPWFWSDQHGCKLQIAGLTAGREHALVRGDVEAGAFSVFSFEGDRLVGVESVNRPADHMAARRLLAGKPSVTPEQAADPSFDLKVHAKLDRAPVRRLIPSGTMAARIPSAARGMQSP